MRYAYTVAQTRALEAAAMAVVGDAALMQRAAHGLSVRSADLLARTRGAVYGARVVILVGPGNNGGDALYAGQRLARRGCAVTAVRALGQPHAAGLAALLAAGGRLVEGETFADHDLTGVDLVVDGVLGIGGRPGLPDRLAALVAAAAARTIPILAVDLPSGVVADTGHAPGGSVQAIRTVTFGTYKPCHLIEPAASRSGVVELVDIGLDSTRTAPALAAWEADDVAAHWPVPGPTSDKYARGVVGVDTGSDGVPGRRRAVDLRRGLRRSGHGPLPRRAGFGGDHRSRAAERRLRRGAGAVVAGRLRLGRSGRRRRGDRRVIDSGVPVVIDADGLRHLPDRVPGTALLTPHAGELARLLGSSAAR